jgi:hypothetical protein
MSIKLQEKQIIISHTMDILATTFLTIPVVVRFAAILN